MDGKRHIVISGMRGVGKSFLVEKLLRELEAPVSGFFTRSTPADDRGYHGIYMYKPDDARRAMSEENHIGDCDGRNRTINLQVFESLGVETLRDARGVIVMDELGFMETGADLFCDAVLRCFDGNQPVLAAIKASHHTAFLNAVRFHPNAAVYEITPENREALFEELLPVIQRWNEEIKQSG